MSLCKECLHFKCKELNICKKCKNLNENADYDYFEYDIFELLDNDIEDNESD
jgi:hypothetical protein